jgi:CRISPR-associated endonuclease/helicase Cas3
LKKLRRGEMSINDFYKHYLGITTPHTYQTQAWDMIEREKYPILLKAPTGSGKTEAVVVPFLN